MIDFNQKMKDVIDNLRGCKPTLLLHSCCAPCSSSVVEKLKPFFEITVFCYNPNILLQKEYEKRKLEQKNFLNSVNLKFMEAEYNVKHFTSDFKKENGYLHSVELSKQLGFYRQKYCGCRP